MQNDFMNDFDNLEVVLPGTRVQSSSPTVKTLSTFNRLEMSKTAGDMLGITDGDKLLIIGNGKVDDVNAMYYIMKHPEGTPLKLSRNKYSFSYAGYYAGMVMGNAGTITGSKEDLAKVGLMIDKAITVKASYDVVPVLNEDDAPIEYTYNSVSAPIFALRGRSLETVKGRDNVQEEVSDEGTDVAAE